MERDKIFFFGMIHFLEESFLIFVMFLIIFMMNLKYFLY